MGSEMCIRDRPYTSESFGEVFREWCTAANMPKGCTAHGLRKACARRLAEERGGERAGELHLADPRGAMYQQRVGQPLALRHEALESRDVPGQRLHGKARPNASTSRARTWSRSPAASTTWMRFGKARARSR